MSCITLTQDQLRLRDACAKMAKVLEGVERAGGKKMLMSLANDCKRADMQDEFNLIGVGAVNYPGHEITEDEHHTIRFYWQHESGSVASAAYDSDAGEYIAAHADTLRALSESLRAYAEYKRRVDEAMREKVAQYAAELSRPKPTDSERIEELEQQVKELKGMVGR